MLTYQVSCPTPQTQFLLLELSVPLHGQSSVALQLPVWRAGRYECQHFAKNVRRFWAADGQGRLLPCRKTSTHRWEVDCQGADVLVFSYEYYATQLDAGGSWVGPSQWNVNWGTCAMWVEGMEHLPYTLDLQLPQGYRVATALPQASGTTWQASDFQELADSPMIASDTLRHAAYEVQGHRFHIWLQGSAHLDLERLAQDYAVFTRECMQFFGGFPHPEFHFMLQIHVGCHYHGVEHPRSTTITLADHGREIAPGSKEYNDLLDIGCHELFHVWNIKAIRPQELQPYDYGREQYFTTGYVAEGVTTYYGDLLLYRCGLMTLGRFQKELNARLQRHFLGYGCQFSNLRTSSVDLWLDGYGHTGKYPIAPWRRVSIYDEGCLAALILDGLLRQCTQGAHGLDRVVQLLWKEHGQTGKGYAEQDYRALCERVAGCDLADYFDEVIGGSGNYLPWLERVLPALGYGRLAQEPADDPLVRRYGFVVSRQDKVAAIAPGSPAEGVLMLGDLVQDYAADDQGLKVSVLRPFEGNLELWLKEGREKYFGVWGLV